MAELSHINERGEAQMVDVGDKPVTQRTARAEGRIEMKQETLDLLRSGQTKKGDVIATARIAGIFGHGVSASFHISRRLSGRCAACKHVAAARERG